MLKPSKGIVQRSTVYHSSLPQVIVFAVQPLCIIGLFNSPDYPWSFGLSCEWNHVTTPTRSYNELEMELMVTRGNPNVTSVIFHAVLRKESRSTKKIERVEPCRTHLCNLSSGSCITAPLVTIGSRWTTMSSTSKFVFPLALAAVDQTQPIMLISLWGCECFCCYVKNKGLIKSSHKRTKNHTF